jgi:hypothetical protein
MLLTGLISYSLFVETPTSKLPATRPWLGLRKGCKKNSSYYKDTQYSMFGEFQHTKGCTQQHRYLRMLELCVFVSVLVKSQCLSFV